MRTVLRFFAAALLLSSASAHAWWNGDWSQRTRLALDAGPSGAGLKSSLSQVPVLVRLHTGNFDFARAKPDGADLRFVAADDRTPLKHHVEKWDPQSELGLVWVLAPTLAPGQADAALWLYFGNPKAPKIDDAKGLYDPQQVAVFHFAENDGAPRDATGFGNHAASGPAQRNPASIIGNGLLFPGGEPLVVPASPTVRFSASSGFTFSAWVKLAGAHDATLYAQQDAGGSLTIAVSGGALAASIEAAKKSFKAAGGALAPDAWHHVAVTAGRRLALYVDGAEIAAAEAELPELQGEIAIGKGLSGELDEVAISSTARPADFIRAVAKGQGPDAQLVAFGEGEEGSGGASYIGILLRAVTLDGWVVIAFLGVMAVVSFWVMVSKTLYVNRCEKENHAFLDAFRKSTGGERLLAIDAGRALGGSSLYHVYRTGVDEVQGRINGAQAPAAAALSVKAIDAIRASLDAAQVRENQKLNRFMVLLTIAISGGPFLGLLGTVVGIMITFAAIAATGDVNVAAIAPGIAAALVATVAGLGVAIPSLFAYNYIGTRIRNVSADMRVFSDEFLTRVAESYGA
jgi:biopolymer transport protein ExbB